MLRSVEYSSQDESLRIIFEHFPLPSFYLFKTLFFFLPSCTELSEVTFSCLCRKKDNQISVRVMPGCWAVLVEGLDESLQTARRSLSLFLFFPFPFQGGKKEPLLYHCVEATCEAERGR